MHIGRLLVISFFLLPLIAAVDPPEPEVEQDAVVAASPYVNPLRLDTTLFFLVDTPASFPGGRDSMEVFIERNIRIPSPYKDMSFEGRVAVGFIVEKDGRLTDITVLRSIDRVLDSCALDVIRRMPPWEPARHEGDTVRMRFVMPVMIRR